MWLEWRQREDLRRQTLVRGQERLGRCTHEEKRVDLGTFFTVWGAPCASWFPVLPPAEGSTCQATQGSCALHFTTSTVGYGSTIICLGWRTDWTFLGAPEGGEETLWHHYCRKWGCKESPCVGVHMVTSRVDFINHFSSLATHTHTHTHTHTLPSRVRV
jgi:hypothetical protein